MGKKYFLVTGIIGVVLLMLAALPATAAPFASQQITPSPIAQATPLPTPIPTSLTPPTNDSQVDVYKDLAAHFEKITTLILGFIGSVITLGGLTAALLGYFSLRSLREIQKDITRTESKLGEIDRVRSELQSSVHEINELVKSQTKELEVQQQVAFKVMRLLRYQLESRDSDPLVRIRSVRMLGEVNDIQALSILIDLLKNDPAEAVKLEAAFGLGRFLCNNPYDFGDTTEKAIEALIDGSKDSIATVRREVIDAFDSALKSGISLPRSVDRRLQEITEFDPIQDVRRVAQQVLEHIELFRKNAITQKQMERQDN